MNILVDGDLLRYRCAFAAERTHHSVLYTDSTLGDDTLIECENKRAATAVRERLAEQGIVAEIISETELEPVERAYHNVKSMIRNSCNAVQGNVEDVTVVLSGKGNFREDIATIRPYKGNRDKYHQPTHGGAVAAYMQRTYNCVVTEGEEADDWLGYTQTRLIAEGGDWNSCIVTCDKDLDMIPGMHYNFLHDRAYFVDDWEADVFFWHQLITGDSTDNIVGIPGAGKVKATKYLAPALEAMLSDREILEGIFALYVQHYGWTAWPAFIENARLLWIRRQKEQIWTPPKLTT